MLSKDDKIEENMRILNLNLNYLTTINQQKRKKDGLIVLKLFKIFQ